MSDLPSPFDEVVSAYLDNDATADESAMLEASEAMRARVAEFDELRAAVAAPVAMPSDELRESNINAALDAADWMSSPGATATTRANSGLRWGNWGNWRETRWQPLAVAATVVLLAAIFGAGFLAGRMAEDNSYQASRTATADTSVSFDSSFNQAESFDSDDAATPDAMMELPATTDDADDSGDSMAEEPGSFEAYTDYDADPLDSPDAESEGFSTDDSDAEPENPTASAPAEDSPADDPGTETEDPSADNSGTGTDDSPADDSGTETDGVSVPNTESPVSEDVINLGSFDNHEALLSELAEYSLASLVPPGEPTSAGVCAASLAENAASLRINIEATFTARVGDGSAPLTDIVLGRTQDDEFFAAYSTAPNCDLTVKWLNTNPSP